MEIWPTIDKCVSQNLKASTQQVKQLFKWGYNLQNKIKIFAIYICSLIELCKWMYADWGLYVSRISKELNELKKKPPNQINKWAIEMSTVLKRSGANCQETEKSSISLAIREMQIKSVFTFHVTLVTMAITKQTDENRCWRGCRQKESL